jgi:integrase
MVRFVKLANAEMTWRGIPVRWPSAFEVNGRPRSRAHRFSLAEVAKLWLAAGALGRRGALIRWMLLTGCRRIEAQKVEWSHIHLDDAQRGPHWVQPAHLTKNHLAHAVPLSAPAVALLRWLPPRETKKSGASTLIFAGRGGKPVQDWTVIRRELLERAGVETGTLHDFRRTMVSALGDHGFDPQVADALLNHAAAATMGGVMGVYQRSELWLKRRQAMDLWADLMMRAVGAAQGKPVSRQTWGFDQPFVDARIVRPERAGPRSAPRSGIPGPRGRRAARSFQT